DPCVQYRSFAGCEEMTQSPFMGFPVLCGDDGDGEESPNGLLPGPAEHLFGLDVPVGDDSSGIHPDEGIERRLDDALRVCCALAQRHFCFPGEHTLSLRVPMFPPHAFHAPQQESKRWSHHGATCQAKVPEDFSNRRQHVVPIHAHQHRPVQTLKIAMALGPGMAGDDWYMATLVLFFYITGRGPFAQQYRGKTELFEIDVALLLKIRINEEIPLVSQELVLHRAQKYLPLLESHKGPGQDVFQRWNPHPRRHDPQELAMRSGDGSRKG